MPIWNPEQPESWARALGLVSLPLFGSRANLPKGDHAALLDGESTGIAFAVGQKDDLFRERKALSWSWSSNLTYTVVIDKSKERMYVGRWDQPDDIEALPLPNEKRAADLVNAMAASEPPTEQTVVSRMIEVFRLIRGNVVRRGGSPADVVQVFNAVLVCTEAARTRFKDDPSLSKAKTLEDFLKLIESKSLSKHTKAVVPKVVLDFPAGEFVETLLDRDPRTEYVLDPSLLLRHAAGELFQEAHIELAKPPYVQPDLFSALEIGGPLEKGRRRAGVFFTPPSLARLMVEETVKAVEQHRPLPSRLEVLDPACGSGVFLIEALRELSFGRRQGLLLRGIDVTDVSCEMTRFCLGQAIQDRSADVPETPFDVVHDNALSPKSDWGKPDIILMNPPFIPWRSMSDADRTEAEQVLGPLLKGHADKALAFLWKAIQSLRPGAALGTLLPVPLLEGRAGQPLRKLVDSDPTLTLTFIGRFQGYGYFHSAIVEPAFLVISRASAPAEPPPVRVVMATLEGEGRAMREVRRGQQDASDPRGTWEVFLADRSDFTAESWMPRRKKTTEQIEALTRAGVPTVRDLFRVHLGIRTGARSIFILTTKQLRALGASASERAYFKPLAENATIRDGRIKPGRVVFYPYDLDGELAITTEDELREKVPAYSRRYLFPYKKRLGAELRKSLRDRKWWELVEPRLTWLPKAGPKFVTASFGRRGQFAYDADGKYAVVQGLVWLWKGSPPADPDVPWAYLALLNSEAFERYLAFFCPTVQGGQYDLYRKHVGRVFLPDLSNRATTSTDLLTQLARIGQEINAGEDYDAAALESAAERAYAAAATNDPVRFLVRECEALSQRGQIDATIDRVIGFFEDSLTDENLDRCDAALRQVDVTKLDPAISLSFLSMTLVEKGRLPARADFITRLRRFLSDSRSDIEIRRLLKGLE